MKIKKQPPIGPGWDGPIWDWRLVPSWGGRRVWATQGLQAAGLGGGGGGGERRKLSEACGSEKCGGVRFAQAVPRTAAKCQEMATSAKQTWL